MRGSGKSHRKMIRALKTDRRDTFLRNGSSSQVIDSQPDGCPSWVPDWTVQKPSSLHDSCGRGVQYSASGNSKEHIECIAGTDEIAVEAYQIAVIDKISSVTNEPKWHAKYFKQVDEMVDSLHDLYPKSIRDLWKCQVPIAGALHPRVASGGDIDIEDSYKAFRKMIKKAGYKGAKNKTHLHSRTTADDTAPPENFSAVEDMSLREKSTNYGALLEDSLQGWRFVTTVQKSCGVAPQNVLEGDVVFIFGGGDVPFMLRRSEERYGAWRLVGECYIHGSMCGSAMQAESVLESKQILRIY